MATRQQKRPARTNNPTARQRIVSGARRHFLAHGFRNVTMDDLAAELGMSKKTVYANFASKHVLLEAVIRDKWREAHELLEKITPMAETDFFGTLSKLLTCIQRQAQEIQPAFLHDIRREAPEKFLLVERLRHDAIQLHFGRVFAAGRKRGWIRKDIATRVLIEVLLGATQAVVNPTKIAKLGLSVQAAYETLIGIVLEGVITQQGRRKL
jgi:AcrR family transcriptional regulator